MSVGYPKCVVLFGVFLIFLSGCASVQREAVLASEYVVQPGTKVDLVSVTNQTGNSFDIDVEQMLSDALNVALTQRNVLWMGEDVPRLRLAAEIVEYSKGDAFKRWVMPGWGSTVLVVRGSLADEDNRQIGSVDAKRKIYAGGAYTIGAWKTVFEDVANDLITELSKQLRIEGGERSGFGNAHLISLLDSI